MTMKTSEKIRINFPEVLERWEQEEHTGSHRWWPFALLQEQAVAPDPVYVYNRRNNEQQDG